AIGLLQELARLDRLPEQYLILEVSAYLRDEQRCNLTASLPPELLQRVQWLDALPERSNGLVLGNEVLDALPVHLVKTINGRTVELGVAMDGKGFVWQERPLVDEHLLCLVESLELPSDYLTEVCPATAGLIASLAD